MRREEAEWIAATLAGLATEEISPLLEIASADLQYRTISQPHIEELVHRPLRARGVRMVHSDIKKGDGIDIAGDLYESSTQSRLAAVGARSILCCNTLPHVADPASFIAACDGLLAPGGWMVVTTPLSYPYTPDPIDRYFRPTPDQLALLFPGYKVVESATLVSDTHLAEVLRQPNPLRDLLSRIVRSLLLRGGVEATKVRMHRLLWLFRCYKISAVVLQKPTKTH
jgi:hypothetical protein